MDLEDDSKLERYSRNLSLQVHDYSGNLNLHTMIVKLLISFSGTGQKSTSIAQRDALLLFRTLCKVCVSGWNLLTF